MDWRRLTMRSAAIWSLCSRNRDDAWPASSSNSARILSCTDLNRLCCAISRNTSACCNLGSAR